MAIDFVTDHLDMGTSGITAFFEGGSTCMAWVFARSYPNAFPRILDAYQANGWYSGVSESDDNFWFTHRMSNVHGSWRSPVSSVQLNTWIHVAWSYDTDATTTPPVYHVNGELVATTVAVVPVGTPGTNVFQTTIGANQGNGADFDGRLDDVRMYKAVLSSSEIQDIYHSRGKDGNVLNMQRRACAEIIPSDTTVPASNELSPDKNAFTVTSVPTYEVGVIAARY